MKFFKLRWTSVLFYIALVVIIAAGMTAVLLLQKPVRDWLSDYEASQPKYEVQRIFEEYFEHPDAENLAKWKQFFRGEDMGFLFEDISCSVAKGDVGALDLARSFQSQLPENQMSVRPEEATLLFSRADAGKFDILIVSQEFADIYHAQSARTESVDWIEMQGGAE